MLKSYAGEWLIKVIKVIEEPINQTFRIRDFQAKTHLISSFSI